MLSKSGSQGEYKPWQKKRILKDITEKRAGTEGEFG